MALASAKQLLDELMGRHRDLAPDDKKNLSGFEEPEVCKHFLVKFCPNELFVNTKADLGPCSKIHDEMLRHEYEKSPHFRKLGYEEDFLRFAQGMLGDVDKRIRRAKQRLALGNQENNGSGAVQSTGPKTNEEEKMQVISERINELLEQVEQLGCEGKVEEAQGIMKLCDQLKEEREALKRAMEPQHWLQQTAEIAAAQEKQMEVCEVCGAFLIVGDAQQRVDDHLMGKQHVGYARLKAAVEEIVFLREKEKEEREKQRAKERQDRQKQREEEDKDRRKTRDDRRDDDRRHSSSSKEQSRTSRRENRNGYRGKSRSRSKDKDRVRRRSRSSERRRDPRRDDERRDRHRNEKKRSQSKEKPKERSRSPLPRSSRRQEENKDSRSHSKHSTESHSSSSRKGKRRSSEDGHDKSKRRTPESDLHGSNDSKKRIKKDKKDSSGGDSD